MSKLNACVIAIAVAACNGDDGSEPPLFNPDGGAVTNGDPKVRLSPTSGLVTTEGGSKATFAVELTEKPRADVKILMHSSNPAEGEPEVDEIVFTSSDWGKRTVNVVGTDDHSIDGNQQFQVIFDPTFSDDLAFHGLATGQIYLTNVDDDAAGVTITTTQSTSLTEHDALTFDVRPNTKPTGEADRRSARSVREQDPNARVAVRERARVRAGVLGRSATRDRHGGPKPRRRRRHRCWDHGRSAREHGHRVSRDSTRMT